MATVVNLVQFINETQAEPEIETLREKLIPSGQIIEVFQRLGEDFKPTSGAMALSQDLTYLDNLVVKRKNDLSQEELVMLTGYIADIRKQMVKLEDINGQIKNKFGSFKQASMEKSNPLLQEKLSQIDRIINSQDTQQTVISIATSSFDTLIENIRECLSCVREGANNDTNLSFGDPNKFYVYSQSEARQQGSISDQIVFVEPITKPDGTREMAFVVDRIYGTNTPAILENQTDVILKKYKAIKQRFPQIKLSVLLTSGAVQSGGASVDMMEKRFREKGIAVDRSEYSVDVHDSAMGDHYVEFGGEPRSAGKRKTNGLLMT